MLAEGCLLSKLGFICVVYVHEGNKSNTAYIFVLFLKFKGIVVLNKQNPFR